MAELKTKVNDDSVEKFINAVKDEEKRKDAFALLELMKNTTKEEPKMWGSSIVGFGSYHYKYASGREGDWPVTGFSPRKENLTIYFCGCLPDMKDQLKKLGKYKTGVGCLYFKKLSDIDQKILKQMLVINRKMLANIIKQRKQTA
jgi:hypothetical protein